MPEGLLCEVVLSSSHCVSIPKVMLWWPFVHWKLSTSVKAFGTTLCVASAAPFSVHWYGPVENFVLVAKLVPGKFPEDWPTGNPVMPISAARYGFRLYVGARTGCGKRVKP